MFFFWLPRFVPFISSFPVILPSPCSFSSSFLHHSIDLSYDNLNLTIPSYSSPFNVFLFLSFALHCIDSAVILNHLAFSSSLSIFLNHFYSFFLAIFVKISHQNFDFTFSYHFFFIFSLLLPSFFLFPFEFMIHAC